MFEKAVYDIVRAGCKIDLEILNKFSDTLLADVEVVNCRIVGCECRRIFSISRENRFKLMV